VTVSIRPEDVELFDDATTSGSMENVTSGRVDQKVFLGDFVDFQLQIGDFTLLSRAHPSLRTPIGETIHVRMNPDKCVAIPEESSARAAA
jgi:iron(III) transport system ATP-binding protein